MAADLRIEHLSGARLIGQGGFSAVYSAVDDRFDRPVAVKLFFRHADERDRARFERECRIMGRLSAHPTVVTVYDAGHSGDDRPYLIMELVAGGSLAARLAADGPMPWPTAVDHLVPIAEALGHGHSQGILHRDVKPDNILLDGDVPKLTDFGIASIQGATSSTIVSASWNHAPPETFSNRRDQRSDLYSLASTLHTLIGGRPPFANPNDESLHALVNRLLFQAPPTLPPELAPPELAALVVRTLAKDPDERPQSAGELIDLLLEVRRPAPDPPAATPARSTAGVPVPSGAGAGAGTRAGEADLTLEPGAPGRPARSTGAIAGPGRRRSRRAVLVAVPVLALASGGAWWGRGLVGDGSVESATTTVTAATGPAGPAATGASATEAPGPVQWNIGPVEVSGVAGLVDGRVAAGGRDGLVRILDPADPAAPAVVLRGHSAPVWDVLALRDGRLASSSDDGTVRIWDPSRPEATPVVLADERGTAYTQGMVELDNGRLAVARLDGLVLLWDPADPEAPPVGLGGHVDSVRSVAVLPDGRLVSGGDDATVRVWDLQRPTAEPVVLTGHEASVWSLAVLPEGRVASAGGDGTIRVWNVDQPAADPVVLNYAPDTLVRRLAALPDGRLAAVDAGSWVDLWEPGVTASPSAVIDDGVEGEEELAVALLPDGRIVTGSRSGEVRVRPVPPR